MMEVMLIKVSKNSNISSVAGAIRAHTLNGAKIEVQAIGAGAVNQAVKSIAVARGYVATEGINLMCIPAFANVNVEGEQRTGIKFILVKG